MAPVIRHKTDVGSEGHFVMDFARVGDSRQEFYDDPPSPCLAGEVWPERPARSGPPAGSFVG